MIKWLILLICFLFCSRLAIGQANSITTKNLTVTGKFVIKGSVIDSISNKIFCTQSGLRAATTGIPNAMYWMLDKGKEGPWVYDGSDLSSSDNAGTIIVGTGGSAPRFKRIVNDNINVTWFGAIGDGVTNSTSAIQAALDFAATGATTSKVVYIPQGFSGNGHYMIDSLKLRNGASIEGDNRRAALEARAGSATGMFVLGDAPVQKIKIENLNLIGSSSNSGQHCFNLTAISQAVPVYTGGIWYSLFRNIDISGFKGHGFHFYCSDGLGDMANQFLTFDNIHATATSDTTSVPFYAQGQFAQARITNCLFDGQGSSNRNTYGIELLSLLTSNDQIQGSVSFDNVTIQAVWMGVKTSFASGVTFTNGWWENDSFGVYGTNKSRIILSYNAFKNIATGSGTYIVGNDLSRIDMLNNGVFGTVVGRMYTSPSSAPGGGDMSGNYGQDHLAFTTVFVGQNINVSSSTLNTGYFKDIVTNGTLTKGTFVTTISSDLSVGEIITVRCYEGSNPNSYVAFRGGGNIDLPQNLDSGYLILRPRQAAIFKRSDLLGNWVLVGLSKTENYADAVPTSGTYWNGEKVWSNHPESGTLFYYYRVSPAGGSQIWDSVTSYDQARVIETGNTSVTLGTSSTYAYTGGTSANWVLPDLATNQRRRYRIINTTSNILIVQASGSDDIFANSFVTQITVGANLRATIVAGPTHWYIEN